MVIVNCISIVIVIVIFALEIVNFYVDTRYNNIILSNIVFVLAHSIFISSFLIKNYQEIKFNYNNSTLCTIFGILSIIFGWYMMFYSKMGDYTFEGLLLFIMSAILYSITSISNIYFTKQVMKIVEYEPYFYGDNLKEMETIVVRNFNFGNKVVKATYIRNQNYKHINFRCNIKIIFYYILSLIIALL